jgi:hypothetical protein
MDHVTSSERLFRVQEIWMRHATMQARRCCSNLEQLVAEPLWIVVGLSHLGAHETWRSGARAPFPLASCAASARFRDGEPGIVRAESWRVRLFLSLFSLLLLLRGASSHADEPLHHKRHASAKRHRAATPELKPALVLAAPGNVPPGAQLTPDRVIEAPEAPRPHAPADDRVVVPASEVTTKRKADHDDVNRSYSAGPDPGRNMQPATGLSPSSQSVVP